MVCRLPISSVHFPQKVVRWKVLSVMPYVEDHLACHYSHLDQFCQFSYDLICLAEHQYLRRPLDLYGS